MPPGEYRLTASRMAGDFFLTLIPRFCTWVGNWAMARDTRFCTSTWFMLGSVPISKVTVRV